MNFGDEFGLRRKPRRVAEINLINMIDMLFFLLVFFVLTSSFTSETGIDINKPKAQSSKTLPKQPLLIGVTRDGSIHVNESPVSIKALPSMLQHYVAGGSRPPRGHRRRSRRHHLQVPWTCWTPATWPT